MLLTISLVLCRCTTVHDPFIYSAPKKEKTPVVERDSGPDLSSPP